MGSAGRTTATRTIPACTAARDARSEPALVGDLRDAACAIAPGEASALEIAGSATITDVYTHFECSSMPEMGGVYACRMRTRAVVQAGESEVAICGFCGDLRVEQLIVDGAQSHFLEHPVPPGEHVTIQALTTVHLEVLRRDRFTSQPPIGVRHPHFGESWLYCDTPEVIRVRPFTLSGGARIDGDVTVAASGPSEVPLYANGRRVRDRSSFPRDVALVLEAAYDRGPPSIPLANGGPALTLTGCFSATRVGTGVRTMVSVGYEVGLFDYMIASAWFETDFEEISEAVIVEGALPSIIYAIPSLSFGIGAVARQLGQRDPDGAFRMRIGAHWSYVGFVGDFDYWPAIREWTATLGMRLGI